MSDEEIIALSDYIISTVIELNGQYPGCISQEELGELVIRYRGTNVSFSEAKEMAKEEISSKVARSVNIKESVSEKNMGDSPKLLKLTRDVDSSEGYILSNSVIVLITLLMAMLVIVVSILLN